MNSLDSIDNIMSLLHKNTTYGFKDFSENKNKGKFNELLNILVLPPIIT